MKSTVPAGTGRAIRRELEPGAAYVSCPEFLKEGSAVEDFLHPDRVVIGADAGDEWAADAVAALYAPLGGEIVRTDVACAEMIKLASNAFLATKISFINEIANVCEEVGADVTEVARGMGLDERIGPPFLRAGHRLRRQLLPQGRHRAEAARRQHRLPLPAAERGDRGQRAAEAAGDRQAAEAPRLAGGQADRAARARLQAEHRRHARGSSLVLAARLQGEGAEVVAYDPVAEERARELLPRSRSRDSALEALEGADAAVLVTEWPEFAELDWARGGARGWRGR